MATEEYDFRTLPDYLAPGLDVVLVGINPATYAVAKGHYFARGTNRFWPAFSRSKLSAPVRAGLGRDALRPEDDARLLEFGIGLTDVVKVPTANAAQLSEDLYREWAPRLAERLRRCAPRVASFHGLTAFRPFARYGLGEAGRQWELGPQPVTLGSIRLFVTPNPSPANAHFRPADYVAWYDRLAEFAAKRDLPIS